MEILNIYEMWCFKLLESFYWIRLLSKITRENRFLWNFLSIELISFSFRKFWNFPSIFYCPGFPSVFLLTPSNSSLSRLDKFMIFISFPFIFHLKNRKSLLKSSIMLILMHTIPH